MAKYSPTKKQAALFEQKFRQWMDYCSTGELALLSSDDACVNSPYFQEIIDMGPVVLPLIFDKLRSDPQAHMLIHALPILTHKQFSEAEMENGRRKYGAPLGNQGMAMMWLDWWENENRSKQ